MDTSAINQFLDFSIGKFTLESLFYILLLVLVCFIGSKILLKIARKLIHRSSLDRSIQIFLINGFKILLIFVSIIIITDQMGISTSSLVALLSVVSLAISLSIQGLLSNVAGGLTILFTRPFVVGDYIELDNQAGKVTQTGLIYTQLQTPDNKTVFLPNSQVCDGQIINYTNQVQRRIEIRVSASYSAETDTVKQALYESIHTCPDILPDPPPVVHIADYKDSAIQYVIYAWIPTALYWDSYYMVMEAIRGSFEKYHVSMDYPHINIHTIGGNENGK